MMDFKLLGIGEAIRAIGELSHIVSPEMAKVVKKSGAELRAL